MLCRRFNKGFYFILIGLVVFIHINGSSMYPIMYLAFIVTSFSHDTWLLSCCSAVYSEISTNAKTGMGYSFFHFRL